MPNISAPQDSLRPPLFVTAVAGLLALLAVLLVAFVRQESQTFDESVHLFAGLQYWKHGDFGQPSATRPRDNRALHMHPSWRSPHSRSFSASRSLSSRKRRIREVSAALERATA